MPRHDEPDTREFWSGTKDKQFRYQQCENCNKVVFYPRRHCTGCTSGKLIWKTASGAGKVYTFSVIRQSYHPFFRNLVPYAVAWVDLEEGPRVLSNIVGVKDPLTEVSIGQDVMLEWEEHEEVSIPLFRPV